MKLLTSFLYVFLAAGMQGSHGRTYHGLLPLPSRHLHNPSFVHHTPQHEVLPAVEQNSSSYGIVDSDVADMARIVGGTEAKKHEFPWVVSLQCDYNGESSHFCGASVIEQRWVMTAAHCAAGCSEFSIVAGEHHLMEDEGGEQHRKVESIIIHPQYNSDTAESDIALMKVAEPLELDGKTVSLISLPSSLTTSTGDCVVTGWGHTQEGGSVSDVLMKVMVPITTDEECQKMYGDLPDSMICAGYKQGGKDSCEGDSGGGLVCQGPDMQHYVAGVVSWGNGCARPNSPGVYTEVSYFVDWISKVMSSRIKLPSRPNTMRLPSSGEGQ